MSRARPVILVDVQGRKYASYPSVSAAARGIGRHPSTVHRALTGDRNRLTTGMKRLFAINEKR